MHRDIRLGGLLPMMVVELVSESEFRWLADMTNVINSGGIKLHPEEMEKTSRRVRIVAILYSWTSEQRWGEEAIIVMENATDANVWRYWSVLARVWTGVPLPKTVINVRAALFMPQMKAKIKRCASLLDCKGLSEFAYLCGCGFVHDFYAASIDLSVSFR